MNIGVICEGADTDAPVIELLFQHLFPAHSFLVRGVSKRVIFGAGDLELAQMYRNGVERVLVVWDLLPTGHRMPVAAQWNERPSRREQRQKLLELLCHSDHLPTHIRQQAHYYAAKYKFPPFADQVVEHPNDDDHFFRLVCVCYTADGWLLADDGVLTGLAQQAGPVKPCKAPHPDECHNPTAFMTTYFAQSRHKRLRFFNKAHHNIVIAQEYRDRDRIKVMLRRSSSFRYAVEAIRQWVGR